LRAAASAAGRVIYFYHGARLPLFALTAYAKSAQADVRVRDRSDFRRLTKILVESYGGGKR